MTYSNILEKLKGWLSAGNSIYEPKLVFRKYLKKHYRIIKSKMYNFMYVNNNHDNQNRVP